MSPAFLFVVVVAAMAFWLGASWLIFNQRGHILRRWANLR